MLVSRVGVHFLGWPCTSKSGHAFNIEPCLSFGVRQACIEDRADVASQDSLKARASRSTWLRAAAAALTGLATAAPRSFSHACCCAEVTIVMSDPGMKLAINCSKSGRQARAHQAQQPLHAPQLLARHLNGGR